LLVAGCGQLGGAANSGATDKITGVPVAGEPERALDAAARQEAAAEVKGSPSVNAKSGVTTAIGAAVSDAPALPSRDDTSTSSATRPNAEAGASLVHRYPGTGFVVHEWGTNTVVAGSDGTLQRGLHHEEEDLPDFVYDRAKQGTLLPVEDKMETPVDYFYSDRARSIQVRVGLPEGLLTQWYPAVARFLPALRVDPGTATGWADPPLDTRRVYTTDACKVHYAGMVPAGGLLDWGTVQVLDRQASQAAKLPDAPLERFTWSYARQVDANVVQTTNPTGRDATGTLTRDLQSERFLFYRGIGSYALPSTVTALERDRVVFTSKDRSTGSIFVLNVGPEQGAFTVHSEGVAAGATVHLPVPLLGNASPLAAYSDQLASAMVDVLVSTGLYDDEARAMVNTWQRQWFRTPGVRVLYLAPSSWLDAKVPLTILPVPDQVVRVMVMRVEVLTPLVENEDAREAERLGGPGDLAARQHFLALGRFAEPRLRRALSLTPRAAALAQPFLEQIAGAIATVALDP